MGKMRLNLSKFLLKITTSEVINVTYYLRWAVLSKAFPLLLLPKQDNFPNKYTQKRREELPKTPLPSS